MSSLHLRARYGAPDSQDWRVDGPPLQLDAERDWVVTGGASELDQLEGSFGVLAERLSGDTLLLSFGNSVGRFLVPGRAALNVVSGKWDEGDFNSMMSDLSREASALPFSSGDRGAGGANFGSATSQVPYHSFLFLRHLLSDASGADGLRPAVESILAAPHRRFEREHQVVPVERTTACNATTLNRMARERRFVEAPEWLAGSPLVRLLNGQLPAVVHQPRVDLSVDTPENRFVKDFLRQCQSLARNIEEATDGESAFAERTRAEAAAVQVRLRQMLQHRLWDEVGPMHQVPVASTVLQRRTGYRSVLRAHELLRRAAEWLPLDDEAARALIELKDIARLYEIWCFFRVAAEVTAILGQPNACVRIETLPSEVTLARGVELRWGGDVSLLYNATFSRSQLSRRSYSLVMYPDITLELRGEGGVEHHLFDAKFKLRTVERPEDLQAHDEVADPETEAKREDLQKMHTYRDAIPSARSVWVLYPGTGAQETFHAERDADTVDGVGAIPLLPQGECGSLRLRLEQLLARM